MTNEDQQQAGKLLGTGDVATKFGIGRSTARKLVNRWDTFKSTWATVYEIPSPPVTRLSDGTLVVLEPDVEEWVARLDEAGAPHPGHLPVGRPSRARRRKTAP